MSFTLYFCAYPHQNEAIGVNISSFHRFTILFSFLFCLIPSRIVCHLSWIISEIDDSFIKLSSCFALSFLSPQGKMHIYQK